MKIRILYFTGRVAFDKNSPAFETGKNGAEIYLEMFPENPKSLNFRSAMKSIFTKPNGTEILGKKVSSQGGGVRTPCTLPLDPPL